MISLRGALAYFGSTRKQLRLSAFFSLEDVIATPKFLTLLHTVRSLPLFTTGEKFGQVKPNAYSPRNLTLKQLSFSPSTIILVGEFSGVWDVFDGRGDWKKKIPINKRTGSVYSCFS